MKISGMVLVGKNEPYLEYCLKSIEGICDEIIMVCPEIPYPDLGGNPKIVKLAQKGYDMDFAKWRNQILDAAKGDWILWLDADEIFAWQNGKEVTRHHMEKVIDNLEEKGVNAVKFLTHHFMYNYFTIDGRNNGIHYSMRLFKNDGRRFTGKVHEYIDLDQKKTATIWDFVIWHFGHCKGIEELANKYRKRRIPDNPYTGHMSKEELQKYLKTHDILRGMIPLIKYDGSLPKVMELW